MFTVSGNMWLLPGESKTNASFVWKKKKKNNIERVVKLVILSSNITCKIDREYVNLFYCV
jgi:hypothetical protein